MQCRTTDSIAYIVIVPCRRDRYCMIKLHNRRAGLSRVNSRWNQYSGQ